MNKFPIYPKYEAGDYCGYKFDPQTDFTDVSQLFLAFYLLTHTILNFYLLFNNGGEAEFSIRDSTSKVYIYTKNKNH